MSKNNHGKCKAINHDFTGKLNAEGYCEWCERLMTDNEETRSYNDILADNEDLTREVENLKAYNRSLVYQATLLTVEVDEKFGRFMFQEGCQFALDVVSNTREQEDYGAIVDNAIKAWKAQQADND